LVELSKLIIVTDITGKEVTRMVTNGSNTYQIDVSAFAPGMYLVAAVGETIIGTEKLVIVK
jgi:Secretion system C-terminal sorting domain